MTSTTSSQRRRLLLAGIILTLLLAAVFTLGSLDTPFEPRRSTSGRAGGERPQQRRDDQVHLDRLDTTAVVAEHATTRLEGEERVAHLPVVRVEAEERQRACGLRL